MASETVFIYIGIIAVVLVMILVLSFRGKDSPSSAPNAVLNSSAHWLRKA